MTQVHFTLKSEEIQSIIEYSVKDDVSKNQSFVQRGLFGVKLVISDAHRVS
ncbi:hypothetical protein EfmJHP38_20860 [Enterococcus faecium]|nr:hypothetical protein EfmJHP38_20860 [Enterococcus faecium]